MAAAAQPGYPDSGPLGGAVMVALALHALLILGLGFKLQSDAAAPATIEVTLAHRPADETPGESDFIAQFDQQGSGSEATKQQLTSDRTPTLDDTVFRDTDSPQPIEQRQAEQIRAAQQVVATRQPSAERRDRAEDHQRDGTVDTAPQPLREIASLRAKLAHQRQLYSKIPRTLVLTAASAKASDQAEYLRHRIEWVEKIGNENYPEEAQRRKLYGTIRLAVALERDGNVAGVEILKSSGQRVLDQAAIRIVRLAAPFQPIPPSIREDRIEVIRSWNFIPGNQFHTSAN